MKHYPQRILLVDRSEADYELILGLLDHCGRGNCELDWLTTYETALEALLDCRYDLYLVDYSLGRHTGLELMQEIANKHCPVPVILLTNRDDPEIEPAGMDNGAADILLKDKLDAYLLDRSMHHAMKRKQVELERDRLLEAQQEQRVFCEALHDIAIALNSTLNETELLERILTNICQAVSCDTADIMLREVDQVHVVSSRGYVEQKHISLQGIRYSLNDLPPLRHIAETGQPQIIADTSAAWGDIAETWWGRSYAGAPIRLRDDVVGFLNLGSAVPNFFNAAHAERLLTFADQAGIAFGNAQLLEAERKQRELAEALREVGTALTATLDFDTILDRLLDQIGRVVPYDSSNVLLVENGFVRLARMRGYEQFGPEAVRAVKSTTHEISKTKSFSHIIETRQPLVIAETATHPYWIKIENLEHIGSWIGAPLLVHGEVLALFSLDKTEPGFYQSEHVELLAIFANQVAPALENAWLFEAEARRRREAENLSQATAALTSALDLDQVIENILLHLAQVIPYDSTCLFLKKDDRLYAVAAKGHPTPEQVIGNSYPLEDDALFEGMRRTLQPVYLSDAQTDSRFLKWGGANFVHGWLGVPLITRGEVIGHLTLDSRQIGAYGEAQATLAQAFANQAAAALENTRLIQAAQEARQLSDNLREIGASMTATLDLNEVLNRILDGLGQVVPLRSASVWLFENNVLHIKAGRGFPSDSLLWSLSLTADQKTLAYEMFKHKTPLIVPDVYEDPRWLKLEDDQHIRSWLGMPLFLRDKALGFLGVDHSQPNFYTQEHIAIATAFAQQAVIAIENARLFEQTQQHATELRERVAERTFELQVMYELAQALGQATQISDVVRLILLHLYQAIPYDIAACMLATDINCQLFMQSQYPFSPNLEATIKELVSSVLKELGDRTCDKIPLDIHRIHPGEAETITHPRLNSLGSLIQVPIGVKGNPVGVLLIGSEKAGQFSPEQARLLRTIADQAAESIERLQSLLAAEHQRLESLIAHLPNGVVLLDTEQRLVLTNPMGQEFLAATGPAIVGDTISFLGKKSIETVLAPTSLGSFHEIKATSGPERLFEVTAKSMAVGPEAGGWLLVIRDVTEERAAQKRIQQQEQMAAVGQLAAGIAHDFNNILTGIIGYAELLQIDPHLPASAQQDLERIANQGHRAAHLVRQILDFSRQSITKKRPLDLASLVREVITLLERTIPENILITLEIDPPPQAYFLNADLSQIQQVITNLAINARDAMPAGGDMHFQLSRYSLGPETNPPHPELKPGSWIVLAISDTGHGILPEYQPHIFEPFFTTKETGKGTGLGLAQVYGIVTEHEGCISVTSEAEKGTIFTLYLPALPPTSDVTAQTIPTKTPHGHGEVILLVEDDPTALQATQDMLEHLGYLVLAAPDGRTGLQVYEQHYPNIGLVLTDMTMPDMDGITLASILSKKNPSVKIVAITGYPLDTNQDTKTWLTHGIVDWLQKPLTIEQLGRTLNRLI